MSPDFTDSDSTWSEAKLSESNLTRKNFFIERADVDFVSEGNSQSFFVSVKYEVEGKYLISIRSKTGIEAARIYLTKDTVLANDRMNQIFYYGEINSLSRKYGIDYFMIPVLFGDLNIGNSAESIESECVANLKTYIVNIGGRKLNYLVNCRNNKLIETNILKETGLSVLKVSYSSFVRSDYGIFPSSIVVDYKEGAAKVEIKIKKINFNYAGKIEFIPGARYERRELL